MQLKMLDCTDIPNDTEAIAIPSLSKSQDTQSTNQFEFDNKPDQVDPGPNQDDYEPQQPHLVETNQHDYYDQYDEFKIRIGDEYQIDLSDYNPLKNLKFRKKIIEKETTIWRPSEQVDESKVDLYLKELSKQNYFNIENALAILYETNYDTEKAIELLKISDFNSNEWTKEDRLLFEQGLWYYGKNFHRINQLLPHKTHANLVSYYYKWKKTRNKKQNSMVCIEATCSTSTNSSETFGESNDSNADGDL